MEVLHRTNHFFPFVLFLGIATPMKTVKATPQHQISVCITVLRGHSFTHEYYSSSTKMPLNAGVDARKNVL